MSEPNAPKTTPGCKQLENMVIDGLRSSVFHANRKEAARVALERLRKNRCVKSLKYIIRIAGSRNVSDGFTKEILDMATKYLNELS